jgi:hypothetical protein
VLVKLDSCQLAEGKNFQHLLLNVASNKVKLTENLWTPTDSKLDSGERCSTCRHEK